MGNPLNGGDRHLLQLVQRDKDAEGWTPVSATVWPLMLRLPPELVTIEPLIEGGRARLTDAGETVLTWT